MQHSVDERAVRMTGPRMHDHARGLVDDQDVVVLVQDTNGERLGLGTQRLGTCQNKIDGARPLDATARLDGLALGSHQALGKCAGKLRARAGVPRLLEREH